MLEGIRKRFTTEIGHYQALSADVRRVLLSYYFYLMAYPLFAVFINAYLWRQDEDLSKLVIYNLFYCLGLPLGFYLNGLLLRFFHTLRLYAVGSILEALSAFLVVMLPWDGGLALSFYGLVSGFGAGLFWSNKNYLSLLLTRGSNRLYYNSLETSGDMVINMIIPVLAGGFISFGNHSGIYPPDLAYKILMFIGLILVIFTGLIVQNSKIADIKSEYLLVLHPTPAWNLVRIYNFLSNIVVGAEFIVPSVLVLVLVGKEGTLGLLNSATAVLSAIVIYAFGRLSRVESGWKIVAVGNLVYFLGTLILALFYGPIAVLIYMAVSTIGWSLRWSPSYAVIMEVMDRQGDGQGQYAYICDNELTFNLGRALGILLIPLVLSTGSDTPLRFIPFITAVACLAALIPLIRLSRRLFPKS